MKSPRTSELDELRFKYNSLLQESISDAEASDKTIKDLAESVEMWGTKCGELKAELAFCIDERDAARRELDSMSDELSGTQQQLCAVLNTVGDIEAASLNLVAEVYNELSRRVFVSEDAQYISETVESELKAQLKEAEHRANKTREENSVAGGALAEEFTESLDRALELQLELSDRTAKEIQLQASLRSCEAENAELRAALKKSQAEASFKKMEPTPSKEKESNRESSASPSRAAGDGGGGKTEEPVPQKGKGDSSMATEAPTPRTKPRRRRASKTDVINPPAAEEAVKAEIADKDETKKSPRKSPNGSSERFAVKSSKELRDLRSLTLSPSPSLSLTQP